jgi:hypothetical protein
VLGAILAVAMLVGLLIALLSPSRGPRSTRTSMRFVVSSPWSLDRLCLAMRSVIREWPEVKEIRVDLGSLSQLDEACAASVVCAVRVTAGAGVEIRLDGCDAHMAAFLLARGVELQFFGSLRATSSDPSETLH